MLIKNNISKIKSILINTLFFKSIINNKANNKINIKENLINSKIVHHSLKKLVNYQEKINQKNKSIAKNHKISKDKKKSKNINRTSS